MLRLRSKLSLLTMDQPYILAHNYLAVMASSVSSEQAFSSAGITISKHRNCLKGDIVEALQCLECMI
jgi:hypothetical protein